MRFCDNRIFNIQTNETFRNSFSNATPTALWPRGRGRERASAGERTANVDLEEYCIAQQQFRALEIFGWLYAPCCFCRPKLPPEPQINRNFHSNSAFIVVVDVVAQNVGVFTSSARCTLNVRQRAKCHTQNSYPRWKIYLKTAQMSRSRVRSPLCQFALHSRKGEHFLRVNCAWHNEQNYWRMQFAFVARNQKKKVRGRERNENINKKNT